MEPKRLNVHQARQRQQAGARLVDIRSEAEQASGMAEGAEALSQDMLLENPALLSAQQETLLICQRGLRSLQLAKTLQAQGFSQVASVDGGTEAWQAADLPMTPSRFDDDFLERYSRQFRLPQVGLDGQQRLQNARIVVVGAGGLGSPAAFYLAAAGIGQLRLVDADVVERSNLQRQILHVEAALGQPKVDSARQRLLALNPKICVEAVNVRLDAGNVERLLADVDVVVDGADNFPARHVLNDACLRLGKPLVYGAVARFHGQVSVFDAGRKPGVAPCYRCLFPEAPSDAPNCAEAGVLGVLPGMIGLIQATEAIKLILGIGEPLTGRLLQLDALAMRFWQTRLRPDPECPACGAGRANIKN